MFGGPPVEKHCPRVSSIFEWPLIIKLSVHHMPITFIRGLFHSNIVNRNFREKIPFAVSHVHHTYTIHQERSSFCSRNGYFKLCCGLAFIMHFTTYLKMLKWAIDVIYVFGMIFYTKLSDEIFKNVSNPLNNNHSKTWISRENKIYFLLYLSSL